MTIICWNYISMSISRIGLPQIDFIATICANKKISNEQKAQCKRQWRQTQITRSADRLFAALIKKYSLTYTRNWAYNDVNANEHRSHITAASRIMLKNCIFTQRMHVARWRLQSKIFSISLHGSWSITIVFFFAQYILKMPVNNNLMSSIFYSNS